MNVRINNFKKCKGKVQKYFFGGRCKYTELNNQDLYLKKMQKYKELN